jgi:hypothetical protein
MSQNPIFKIKTSKRSNPETRTTLDALHCQKVEDFEKEKKQIVSYKDEIKELENKLKTNITDIEIWQTEQQIERLQKKIRDLENGNTYMDYFLRSGEILLNYYDMQEQIHRGEHTTHAKKGKNASSILSLLEIASEDNDVNTPAQSVASNFLKSKNESKVMQRNDLLQQYLQIENPDKAHITPSDLDDVWIHCDECGAEMIMCMNEAVLTCDKCGYQEFILVDSDKPSYKDPPREVSYYAYKKINHFNEWLAQFQAKESTDIPPEIYDAILVQLKKERITNMATLKPTKLREILRTMKCSKYYEHIPHIINRLNGQNAPFMSRENEEKLRHMFREIQPSFKKHIPKGRRNFLSYGYVLYKFCELLEMDEFLQCFPLLKNRDKLYNQDQVWSKICKDLGWQFIKTV